MTKTFAPNRREQGTEPRVVPMLREVRRSPPERAEIPDLVA